MKRKTNNIPKISVIFIILIFSLVSISISYAGWTDTININGSVNTQQDFNYLNLSGYWKFDENTGTTAYDSSSYQNHADIYGASWTAGKINYALDFDGTNDYVDCGNGYAFNFLTEDFTVMTWVYIRDQWTGGSGSNLNVSSILDKGTGHRVDGYGLHFSGNNMKIRFSTDGDGSGTGDTARKDLWNDNPLNYNQWYHVVAVRETGIKSLYINGVKQSTTQNDPRELSDLSRSLVFGKHDMDSGGWFNGKIDNVKIYSTALTEEEIQHIYNTEL